MKYAHVKRGTLIVAVALAAVLLGAVVLSGCQQPGKIVAEEKDVLCPHCKVVTETTRIKGMNFKTHICPDCKKVYKEVWLGSGHSVEVGHVCPKCGALVETCKACREGK